MAILWHAYLCRVMSPTMPGQYTASADLAFMPATPWRAACRRWRTAGRRPCGIMTRSPSMTTSSTVYRLSWLGAYGRTWLGRALESNGNPDLMAAMRSCISLSSCKANLMFLHVTTFQAGAVAHTQQLMVCRSAKMLMEIPTAALKALFTSLSAISTLARLFKLMCRISVWRSLPQVAHLISQV